MQGEPKDIAEEAKGGGMQMKQRCRAHTPLYIKYGGWQDIECELEEGHSGKHKRQYEDIPMEW